MKDFVSGKPIEKSTHTFYAQKNFASKIIPFKRLCGKIH
jgi:hypothetical protein